MKKLCMLLIYLLIEPSIEGQNFEWASTGSNLFVGYSESCMTPDGHLIAAGQYEQPSYYPPGTGDPVFYSGQGNEFPLGGFGSQLFLASYSNTGEIDWKINGDMLGYGTRLLGIACRENGVIVLAFQADYVTSNLSVVPSEVMKVPDNSKINYDEEEDDQPEFGEYHDPNSPTHNFTCFAEISSTGDLISIHAVQKIYSREWSSFHASPDGGLVISCTDDIAIKDETGKTKNVGHNMTIKLDENYTSSWEYNIRYLDISCCSFFEHPSYAVVGKDGDVFITGNARDGVRMPGAKDHMAPILDEVTQYNPTYESYIARLSKEGKLKWVQYTGGKSIIEDLKIQENQLIIGGRIQLHDAFMNLKIDTNDYKRAFLASLTLDGKPKWIKTFKAGEILALSTDHSGNIFASMHPMRYNYTQQIIIENDTIKNPYGHLTIVSFDRNGKYRWNKTSKAAMTNTSEAYTHLHNDDCGNLFITGEMWFALPVNMNVFDAAFVTGRGYGGAPLAAKIRTTIPDELLSMNSQLTFPELENVHSSNPEFQTCKPAPFPWKMSLYPNPNNGHFMLQIITSYTDDQVSIELWDSKGSLIRQLSPAQLREAGMFEFIADISDVANGQYLVVVKGTAAAVSAWCVVTK